MSTLPENTSRPENRLPAVLARLVAGDTARPPTSSLPGGKAMGRYLLASLVGAVPCLAWSAHWFGGRVWAMWATAFAAGASVEIVTAAIRRRPMGGGSLVYGALFALVLPPEVPLWMVALGMMFGTLFGKEAFGGTGCHIFSPVLVAKGFLLFSYPTRTQGVYFGNLLNLEVMREIQGKAELVAVPDAWLVAALLMLAGAVVLACVRPASLLITAAILAGAAGVAIGFAQVERLPYGNVIEFMAADGFLFGACFLAVDPACSPRDRGACVLYGLLIGTVAVLMRTFSTYSEAMLCAVLVGNLFAPTLDILAAGRQEGRVAP
ncbi:MAG: RnfABCDGE type electron transport complex subunit D [Lentisphaeria bacterium]|nr:RnfABCDGE type electron transport complex subunit D [Lentisphaeria bacterium]